ncbi:MAG: hypothetical protein Q9191_007301 [Dirinaria sp. TL-2023a]
MDPSRKHVMTSKLGSEDRRRDLNFIRQLNAAISDQLTGKPLRMQELLEEARMKDEGELATLREKNLMLAEVLAVWKDELFRGLPASQVPGSALVKEYANLGILICEWIENEIPAYLDSWRKRHDSPPRLDGDNEYPSAKWLLASLPDGTQEYNVQYRLQWMLHDKLFKDDTFLKALLSPYVPEPPQGVDSGMKSLQPDKDEKATRVWRTKTLADVSGTVVFAARLQEATIELAESIFNSIVPYFPIVKRSNTSSLLLREKVIEPAVDLAIKIHASPVLYSFLPQPSMPSVRGKGKELFKDHLLQAKMIDVKSGKALDSKSVVLADGKAKIGTKLATIIPSLLCNLAYEGSFPLTQEVILITLEDNLRKRKFAAVDPDEGEGPRKENALR